MLRLRILARQSGSYGSVEATSRRASQHQEGRQRREGETNGGELPKRTRTPLGKKVRKRPNANDVGDLTAARHHFTTT